MNSEIVLGILFWIVAGLVAGVTSGALRAKFLNDRKVGKYFHEGNCGIKDLIGGIAGVAVATLLFMQFIGGIWYLFVLVPLWVVSEKMTVRWLVKRFDQRLEA